MITNRIAKEVPSSIRREFPKMGGTAAIYNESNERNGSQNASAAIASA
jgi:hypothetical protein